MGRQNWKGGNMLYPLPAVMVSCARNGEKPNIITVAWAGTVCTNPPMVSISVRPERYSHALIHESKEFVINLTTGQLAKAMDYCGVRSGKDVDKFRETGLTPLESRMVSAPGIAESPVCMECKVIKEEALGSHTMFLAEVVNVSVLEEFLDSQGKLDLNKADLIAYSHGDYLSLGKKVGSFGYSVRKKKKGNKGKSTKKQEFKHKNREKNGEKIKFVKQ